MMKDFNDKILFYFSSFMDKNPTADFNSVYEFIYFILIDEFESGHNLDASIATFSLNDIKHFLDKRG